MTGHQENPGTGYTLQGEPATIMDIETIVRALGVERVRTVNPLRLNDMKAALDWAYREVHEGPVVLITRWPCVLKKLSTEDRREFRPVPSVCIVHHDQCIGCKKCLTTGCPALSFDKYERKVSIDALQCDAFRIVTLHALFAPFVMACFGQTCSALPQAVLSACAATLSVVCCAAMP